MFYSILISSLTDYGGFNNSRCKMTDSEEKNGKKKLPSHKVWLQDVTNATCPANFLCLLGSIGKADIPKGKLELADAIVSKTSDLVEMIRDRAADVSGSLHTEAAREEQKESGESSGQEGTGDGEEEKTGN